MFLSPGIGVINNVRYSPDGKRLVFRVMRGNPAELLLFGAKKAGLSPQRLAAVEAQLGLAGGKWNFANFIIYMRAIRIAS